MFQGSRPVVGSGASGATNRMAATGNTARNAGTGTTHRGSAAGDS